MELDITHLPNRRILEYLGHRKANEPLIAAPSSVKDPYMNQGCHPEVVERVWDKLGTSMPTDCRCLVHGTPALVHPTSGILFACCFGTAYSLRLTPQDYQEALKKGFGTIQHWSDGTLTDATQEFGSDWIWGRWSIDEIQWCNATYAKLSDPA